MAKTESTYSGKDIQVLEGLEAVRKRPGMYIGSTGPRGLHHLVWEVVDNSVDEALGGFCNKIDVTINEDGSCTVEDNGRGIPVDKHPKLKIPTLEVVLTVLHAGGKFGGDGYKVSGGLHGVGVSVVNALSTDVKVQVRRDGQIYEMNFRDGKTVGKMEVIGKSKTTGTTVTELYLYDAGSEDKGENLAGEGLADGDSLVITRDVDADKQADVVYVLEFVTEDGATQSFDTLHYEVASISLKSVDAAAGATAIAFEAPQN